MSGLPSDYLAQLQAVFPRRDGPHWWHKVRSQIPTALSAGATWEGILKGTQGYAAYCDRQELTGTPYVKPASNFFDYRTQGWSEDFSIPEKPKSAADQAQEARWAGLRARSAAIRFRDPLAVESADIYETQLRQAERAHAENRRSYGGIAANAVPNVVSMLTQAKRA